MAIAAELAQPERSAGRALPQGAGTARQRSCLLIHGRGCDRTAFQALALESHHRLAVVSVNTLAAARGELAAEQPSVIFLDPEMHDGDGLVLLGEISSEIRTAAIPVIVVTRSAMPTHIVRAMRQGATDYLVSDGLTVNDLDRTLSAILGKQALAARDSALRNAELRHEVATLRRLAARNMRLLKAQSLPLLAFAWKMAAGSQVGEADQPGTARRLARLTRGMTGLIDETTILAATRHGAEDVVPVNLGHLLDDILAADNGELRASSAHLHRGALPVLRARRSHLALLMRELLTNAFARPGSAWCRRSRSAGAATRTACPSSP